MESYMSRGIELANQSLAPCVHQTPEEASSADTCNISQDDVWPEVVMALDVTNGTFMGCAFFTTADGILYISQDVPMADANVAQHFVSHVQPTTILVSSKAPQYLLEYLEKEAALAQYAVPGGPSSFITRSLASSEFSQTSSLERLLDLQANLTSPSALFSQNGHNFSHRDLNTALSPSFGESTNFKMLRFGSFIDLESCSSINCSGAVIAELHRKRSTGLPVGSECPDSRYHVNSIQPFALADYVFVSSDTLRSLQIIQQEWHPISLARGSYHNGPGERESLSIYGLFHRLASTPQGRFRLRRLILCPTMDMTIISERQRAISMLLRPDNAEKVKQATGALRKISDIKTVIALLRRGVDCRSMGHSASRCAWTTLRRFTAQALKLREIATTLSGGEGVGVVEKLVADIHLQSLMALGNMINKTIDFDQSEARRRSSVKAGIDAQLDELKRSYDGMGNLLNCVADNVSKSLPEWAGRYLRSCIYLPQLGFLIAVESDPHSETGKYGGEGAVQDHWEKIFASDGAVYYKNGYMKELDECYGDIYCQIGDMEVEIIHNLATAVLEHENALTTTSTACADFDALLALAMGAEKYNWTAPQLTKDSIIHIEGGRHPLQELAVPSFVPNDCFISSEHSASSYGQESSRSRLFVVTGPNQSGKSIYLKQVALIVYLAHIGSFVPANRAVVGITDRILTRISTREWICRTESAFAIDLKQVAHAMRYSTPSSLVLIDEFGKGTNADDGIGLFAAVLDHFLSMGSNAPRLLFATHFHELFQGCHFERHDGPFLGHMEVTTGWDEHSKGQVTYLYKLIYGHSTSSFGGCCAALNGVPNAVVDRAEAIALLLSRNEDVRSSCVKLTRKEEEELRIAEAVARRFVAADFSSKVASVPDRLPAKAVLCGVLSGKD